MTGDRDSTGWQDLREFADVDLARSFVLSWSTEGEALIVDIDLFLEPQHPFYEAPRPAEKVCIRPAVIEFPFFENLRLTGSASKQASEIINVLGHGAIEDLSVSGDGCYEIRGEFGTVSLQAERPLLRLKAP